MLTVHETVSRLMDKSYKLYRITNLWLNRGEEWGFLFWLLVYSLSPY